MPSLGFVHCYDFSYDPCAFTFKMVCFVLNISLKCLNPCSLYIFRNIFPPKSPFKGWPKYLLAIINQEDWSNITCERENLLYAS